MLLIKGLKDELATKDNMSFNIGVPGMGSMGFSTADNFLRADSTGNVMMGDDLAMLGANGAGQTGAVLCKDEVLRQQSEAIPTMHHDEDHQGSTHRCPGGHLA